MASAIGILLMGIFTVTVPSTADFVTMECQSSTGHPGQSSKLNCVVKAQREFKIMQVFWRKDGDLVMKFDGGMQTEDERFQFADTNWMNSYDVSLLVKDTKISDEGNYSCIVVTNRGISKGDARLDIDKRGLGGQVLSFPEGYVSSYVRLTPLVSKALSSATFCLRFYTDQLSNDNVLFLLDITGQPAALTIFGHFSQQPHYELRIEDKSLLFFGLQYNLNKWNSLCTTWDGNTGMSQMIVNKTPSVRKLANAGGSLAANNSVILGPNWTSFMGHITDVHVWDYVNSPSEIQNYMENDFVSYTLGNYLNWRSLDYSINGYVLVEDINTLNSWS
ncbi:female protein-like isoform X1 [Alosa pseudoharengus]|uniref:female protein-like isoform X1 n=1 Tax=Alosa pseudoharengus TaxID=34774 RepID=UPI003F88A1B2